MILSIGVYKNAYRHTDRQTDGRTDGSMLQYVCFFFFFSFLKNGHIHTVIKFYQFFSNWLHISGYGMPKICLYKIDIKAIKEAKV